MAGYAQNAVGPEERSRGARSVERGGDVHLLGQRGVLGQKAAVVLEPSEVQRQELALNDGGGNPNELLLDQLLFGDGDAELNARARVVDGRLVAGARRAERAEGDTEPRVIEATEGPEQAPGAAEHVFLADAAVVQHDLARGARAKRHLAADRR